MKLKIFNIHNTPKAQQKGRPFIAVSAVGCFTINPHLEEQLKLEEGQAVVLTQDEARPKDWYLVVEPKCKDGFPIRRNGKRLCFSSAGIKDYIFKSVGHKEKSGRIGIGAEAIEHEGLTLIPLITSTLTAKAQ